MYKPSSCRDAATISTFSDPYCAFTGLTFMFVFMANGSWFFCAAFNIFMTLMRWKIFAEHLTAFRIGYYAMSYLLPWLPITIVMAKRKIVGGSINCLPDGDSDNGWWLDGFFFLWIGIWIVGAILLMTFVLIRVVILMGFRSIGKQRRLLIFCLIYGYVGIYTLAYRIHVRVKAPEMKASLIHYANCTFHSLPNCSPGYRLSGGASLMNVINEVSTF